MARFRLPFRVPQLHFLSRLGPRTRKVLRYTGITVFGLFVFVFALQLSLPVERAKDKIIEALQDKYDIQIGSIERGWMPGRIYLKNVSLRTRPTKPEEQVVSFYIEKLKADVGILSLVGGNLTVDLDAKIGAGKLSAHIVLHGLAPVGGKGITAKIEGDDLPSSDLPARLATNGLPMSGKLDISAELDLPKEKNKQGVVTFDWTKAEGFAEIECPTGCSFGDGKSKWKPIVKNHSQQGMVGDGIEIEPVEVTKLDARIEIKDGHAKVTKIEAPSPDAELKLDFDMKLQQALDDSIVNGCLRFKIADGLYKRKPKAEGAFRNTGAELRNDGYFHIKLTDTFKDMRKLNLECGPNAAPDGTERTAGPAGVGIPRPATRPNLTVTPEEPPRPGQPGAPMPAMPPQPPPPPPTPPPTAGVPPVAGSAGSGSAAPGSAAPGSAAVEGSGSAAPGSGGPPNAVLQ